MSRLSDWMQDRAEAAIRNALNTPDYRPHLEPGALTAIRVASDALLELPVVDRGDLVGIELREQTDRSFADPARPIARRYVTPWTRTP